MNPSGAPPSHTQPLYTAKMATIYKHQHIDRRSSFAGLGLFATKKIPAGTILTIDLMALGTLKELTGFLDRHNVNLRGKLHPRGIDNSLTFLKVVSNAFDGDRNAEVPHALGETISFYNHSCTPNAAYSRYWVNGKFMYTVVAVEEIKKREEIRIFYGYHTTHAEKELHYTGCKGCDATEEDFMRWNSVASGMIDRNQLYLLVEAWQRQERTAVEKAILENYQKLEHIAPTLFPSVSGDS